MTTLVTGANGFVGAALCGKLLETGHRVRGAVRAAGQRSGHLDSVVVGDLTEQTDWTPALAEVDSVVHLAARVHVMVEQSADPLALFRRVNVEGSVNLARQAAQAGVKRFVFVSSVKVNGERTEPGRPFVFDDVPAPQDAYGISKSEAESALNQLATQTGMELVIIRPPLVYGPGVKANFDTMMRWLHRGVPLPLGGVTRNRRSLIALDNLVDLLTLCLTHPGAANQTFLASDGHDLSTTELLTRLGQALGKPARLLPVPERLLELGAALIGKREFYDRLCGSLQVDIARTRQLLSWSPPVTVDEGLRLAVRGLRG